MLAVLHLLAACGGGGGGSSGGADSDFADLALTQISFTPTAIDAGDAIQVSDTVENHGSNTAAGAQVRVYLSDDASIDANDLMLGSRTIVILAPGAISTSARMLHVPVNTTPGTYFVGAVAGGAAEFEMSSSSDNARLATGTLTIEPPMLPDLTCETVTVSPSVVNSGETIDVSDTVRNRGIDDADSFQVAVYLSKDATISASDALLGVRGVTRLAPGAMSTVTGELTIPPATIAGVYRIGAVADYLGSIVEAEELNNSALWSGTLQVLTPPRPDLDVQNVTFTPTQADAGTSIDVSELIANLGVVDAPSSTVAVYLSVDGTITRNDILMGTHPAGALAAGESSNSSGSVVVPAETEAGTYSVGAIADHANAVAESDESNNANAADGVLVVTVPPRPDLAVDSVAFSPTVVDSSLGVPLRVDFSVTNVGVLPCSAFRVGAYLSSNSVLSTSDLVVGFQEFSGLAIGDAVAGTLTIALPGGISSGSYYVGVIADDDARVLELKEANNIRFGLGTLDVVASPAALPNLVVSSVTFAPHQAPAGGTLQVQSEVRNVGTLSAGAFKVGIYLSRDDSISTDDVRLGERVISHLGIQFGSASSAPYSVPIWIAPGSYFVGAVADDLGAVAETSEDDNALKATGALTVVAPPSPGAEPLRAADSPATRQWITFQTCEQDVEASCWYAHEDGCRVDLYARSLAWRALRFDAGRPTPIWNIGPSETR